MQSVLSWDGDKLVHTQKWGGKETTITRYINENGDLAMVKKLEIFNKCLEFYVIFLYSLSFT